MPPLGNEDPVSADPAPGGCPTGSADRAPTLDGPAGDSGQQLLQPLTNDLIATVLSARGYSFHVDSDGDLVGRWDGNLIYFLRLGTSGELLQVRTVAATRFPIEHVPALYEFCNVWNHDRVWPKAFVHVDDDGSARVLGEVVADLELGVALPQLDQLIHCGISTGCQLAAAVAELRT